MSPEQRAEIDELLAGPSPEKRRRRIAQVAAVGGQIVGSRTG